MANCGCETSPIDAAIRESLAPTTAASEFAVPEEIAALPEPEIVPWFKCWKCGLALLIGILLASE